MVRHPRDFHRRSPRSDTANDIPPLPTFSRPPDSPSVPTIAESNPRRRRDRRVEQRQQRQGTGRASQPKARRRPVRIRRHHRSRGIRRGSPSQAHGNRRGVRHEGHQAPEQTQARVQAGNLLRDRPAVQDGLAVRHQAARVFRGERTHHHGHRAARGRRLVRRRGGQWPLRRAHGQKGVSTDLVRGPVPARGWRDALRLEARESVAGVQDGSGQREDLRLGFGEEGERAEQLVAFGNPGVHLPGGAGGEPDGGRRRGQRSVAAGGFIFILA